MMAIPFCRPRKGRIDARRSAADIGYPRYPQHLGAGDLLGCAQAGLGSHLVEHDAAMLQTNGKFYLVFKDERPEPLKKFIKLAEGPTVEGPWSKISEEFTESWSEGPSALYPLPSSKDLSHWTSLDGKISFPPGRPGDHAAVSS
jgi:hypothetical protein